MAMFASRTGWKLEPNALSVAIEAHRRHGRDFVDLTASNPTTCGFEYPEQEILSALADRRALTYSPNSKGLPAAREAVAEYYAGREAFSGTGAAAHPDRIILVSGTSEAYSHLFRLLCEPGDEILVPAPSYPLFEFLADLNDVRLLTYPLIYDHGWHLDLHALRQRLTSRSRAVMVVHPNNPTGSFVKAAEAAALAKVCAERRMAIIADEVFLDYHAGAKSPPTFCGETETLTFTLSGLSKICALPQMKLAWIVVSGPVELARAATERLDVIADTYLSPGTPVQWAAPKLLALRSVMLPQIRRRASANLAHLDQALCASPTPLTRLEYEGGWYAVLRGPATGSDEDLAVELLERASVLIHPGKFFNFAKDGFLVLSLMSAEKDFQAGSRAVIRFFA